MRAGSIHRSSKSKLEMTALNHLGVVREHREAPHLQKDHDRWEHVRGDENKMVSKRKAMTEKESLKESQEGLAGQRRLGMLPE